MSPFAPSDADADADADAAKRLLTHEARPTLGARLSYLGKEATCGSFALQRLWQHVSRLVMLPSLLCVYSFVHFIISIFEMARFLPFSPLSAWQALGICWARRLPDWARCGCDVSYVARPLLCGVCILLIHKCTDPTEYYNVSSVRVFLGGATRVLIWAAGGAVKGASRE